jgi:hypothetical protein
VAVAGSDSSAFGLVRWVIGGLLLHADPIHSRWIPLLPSHRRGEKVGFLLKTPVYEEGVTAAPSYFAIILGRLGFIYFCLFELGRHQMHEA